MKKLSDYINYNENFFIFPWNFEEAQTEYDTNKSIINIVIKNKYGQLPLIDDTLEDIKDIISGALFINKYKIINLWDSTKFVYNPIYNVEEETTETTTYGERNETSTYGERNETTTYGERNETSTYGERNETSTYGERNETTTYGERNETSTYGERNETTTYGERNETTSYGDRNEKENSSVITESMAYGSKTSNENNSIYSYDDNTTDLPSSKKVVTENERTDTKTISPQEKTFTKESVIDTHNEAEKIDSKTDSSYTDSKTDSSYTDNKKDSSYTDSKNDSSYIDSKNDSSYTDSKKEESKTDTKNLDSYVDKKEIKRSGNIGVKSTQALILEQREVVNFSFWNMLIDIVIKEITIPYYERIGVEHGIANWYN